MTPILKEQMVLPSFLLARKAFLEAFVDGSSSRIK
jgi:hypothetical protein